MFKSVLLCSTSYSVVIVTGVELCFVVMIWYFKCLNLLGVVMWYMWYMNFLNMFHQSVVCCVMWHELQCWVSQVALWCWVAVLCCAVLWYMKGFNVFHVLCCVARAAVLCCVALWCFDICWIKVLRCVARAAVLWVSQVLCCVALWCFDIWNV